MKNVIMLAVLAVFSACVLAGCAPDTDNMTPIQTEKPQSAEATLRPSSLSPVPVQSTAPPEEAFSLTVPYKAYPEDVESITVTVHIPDGDVVFGAHAPQLERLYNGKWTALSGMGYCGTPDEIKDGALVPLPVSSYEGVSPGEYRVSLSVSDNLSLETDIKAYAYFELTEGMRVTADPRSYPANAASLTLMVINPSEGLVTLADLEIQIEMLDGVGYGLATAKDSLALEQGEELTVSVSLAGLNLPPGTYRAVVILQRNFKGEDIREVRLPEFEIK